MPGESKNGFRTTTRAKWAERPLTWGTPVGLRWAFRDSAAWHSSLWTEGRRGRLLSMGYRHLPPRFARLMTPRWEVRWMRKTEFEVLNHLSSRLRIVVLIPHSFSYRDAHSAAPRTRAKRYGLCSAMAQDTADAQSFLIPAPFSWTGSQLSVRRELRSSRSLGKTCSRPRDSVRLCVASVALEP